MWLAIGIAPVLVSCAGSGRVLGPVGPQPVHADTLAPAGFLKVYTATENHADASMHYFPHTGYTVYAEDGKTVVTNVANASSVHDEDALLVQLPAGKYLVEARADRYGTVRVGVVIERGQLTTVNLRYDWNHPAPPGNASDWVRLSDGTVVGWSAGANASQRQ
jgi:hypothetical protein